MVLSSPPQLLRNSDGSDSGSNDRQAPEGASAGSETPRRPVRSRPIHQLSRSAAAPGKTREVCLLPHPNGVLSSCLCCCPCSVPIWSHSQISELQDQLSQLQDEFTQKEAECATLRNMVEERNTFITTMKTEIYRKEYRNDTERVELHSQILQKDAIITKLEVRPSISAMGGGVTRGIVGGGGERGWVYMYNGD